MKRFLPGLLCAALPLLSYGQVKPEKPDESSELKAALNFELPPDGNMPGGWRGGPRETIFMDDQVVHSGRRAVRIERTNQSPNDFSTITKSIDMDFSGASLELRGYLRTEEVSDFVGLWLREDGHSPDLAFDNMQNRQLKGTTDWAEYSISLPIRPEARKLVFGVLLSGTGKTWVNGLQLLVDGKPIWEAPKVSRPTTVVDRDHQFDGGSGISITNDLSKTQIENLTTLGKVWGFLKYHHPKVTGGQISWDDELFRVMPQILSARDQATANAVLVKWIDGLGQVEPCKPCAKLDERNLYFRPDVEWIANHAQLGDQLSQRLESIYEKRMPSQQFYVSTDPKNGNAIFRHELGYDNLKFPDAGFQILALFRFWNIVEYWYPYRDVTGEKWDAVLNEFLPRVGLAKDAESYRRALMALIAKVHDGHANLWSSLQDRPPVGNCSLPVDVRFVEDLPVINAFSGTTHDDLADLKIGDVITQLDGVPIRKLIESWSLYYGASNDAARLSNVGKFLTRGKCGETSIGIMRDGQELQFEVERVPGSAQTGNTHDLSGPTFKLLSKDVAYLKLSSVKAAEAGHYVQQASGTKGLIIDIRNYPSEFMVFALGSHLVEHDTPFARFTTCDLSNPGAFHWGDPVSLVPQKPFYVGRIVILVDETSMSQAEYTGMAFRAARAAVVVGSQTAGADGNVSPFLLPGGLRSMISGIGVFYPDKKPTQRIGIVPNVEVRPTIEGIRAGRDEVLEEALRQISGNHVPTATIKSSAP